MPRFTSSFVVVFTLLFAVVVAFPQPNSDDSPPAVVETPADTPEASAPTVEGESVDLRFRPSYGYGGQQYGGQQYGSNYYSSERYESHHSSQQYGHQNYGHQNYGHHNAYGNYGHGYERPYGYGGYPGGYGYYGRPQGILGTVGNVLDGLLGLREGEKKPAVEGVVSSAPVVAAEAVNPSAVVPEADSLPQIPVEVANLPEPVPVSEGVSPDGGEVIFQ